MFYEFKKIKLPEKLRTEFRFSTLSFLFIILYVNVFQKVFGAENSIVGVIFTIMMSASMVRDMTAEPVKNLLTQALLLVWMANASSLVTVLPLPFSFIVNFATIMLILYSFTYEYSSHIYFPYILSYLFLIFISPVDIQGLPVRIAGMLFGAFSIIMYQWFMGRNRVVDTAKDVLSEMIDRICQYIVYKRKESSIMPDLTDMHSKLGHLSRTVYDRRKRVLCVSDAGFSMLETGRSLEKMLRLIEKMPEELTVKESSFLQKISERLKIYRTFLQGEIPSLPPLEPQELYEEETEQEAHLYNTLLYTQDRLEHMTNPEAKSHYRKTKLPLKTRIKIALDLSPVRAVYALRTSLLLSFGTLFVLGLNLPHGKWLMFTLASVSLPYADDVPAKIKNRILATVSGGLIAVLIYSLIPSAVGRTAVMMFSGYVSFYFVNYRETFACSTVGALGGAVFANAFTFTEVGSIFLIRIGYILLGSLLGYAANCFIFPYSRQKAERHLWKKYKAVTEYLSKKGNNKKIDDQLYYNLVIHSCLMKDKLSQG